MSPDVADKKPLLEDVFRLALQSEAVVTVVIAKASCHARKKNQVPYLRILHFLGENEMQFKEEQVTVTPFAYQWLGIPHLKSFIHKGLRAFLVSGHDGWF